MKKIIQLFNILELEGRAHRKNPNRMRVYDPQGLAPTIHTKQGGQQEPYVLFIEDE